MQENLLRKTYRTHHATNLPTNPPSTSQEITLAQVGNNHHSFDLLNHRNFNDDCFYNPLTSTLTNNTRTMTVSDTILIIGVAFAIINTAFGITNIFAKMGTIFFLLAYIAEILS